MEGNQDEVSEEEYFEDEIPEEDLEYQGEEMDLGGSEPKPLGGIYQLFDTVLNKARSTKVSNLNKDELGDLGISIRDSMRIALLANSFGHPRFANFFLNQAGIVSDSAMSKEGWFTELFVTSKRYASRESASSVKTLPQFNKGKWKMFSAKGKESQSQ